VPSQLAPSSFLLPNYLCSSLSYKKYHNIDPVAVHFSKTGIQKDLPCKISDYLELINKFNAVIFYLKNQKSISVESLITANSIFTDDDSGVRRLDCWVGKEGSNTEYKCPHPSELEGLLVKLVTSINKGNRSIDHMLYIYFKLISIHPFRDGNGRTSRALFYTLTRGKYDKFFCPSLYHTKENHLIYFNLVKLAYLGPEILYRSNFLKKFKKDAKLRISLVDKHQRQINQSVKSLILSDKHLLPLAKSIYKKLYQSPFLNIEEVHKLALSEPLVSEYLNALITKGVIKAQRTRSGEVYIYSDLINKFSREFHLLTLKRKRM